MRGDHAVESYEQQADVTLNQANPVSGTYYTILDTTKKARIIGGVVIVTQTVVPTHVKLKITIDGVSIIWTQGAPATATFYAAYFQRLAVNEASQVLAATSDTSAAFIVEGKSVKVEAEVTGGTVSNLSGRVKYAVLKP